jgi:hypothetical protein
LFWTFPPGIVFPAGVFKPAESDALADKLAAANHHRAATPECRRKTTDPERFRLAESVFVSRLHFPAATLGVVFIWRWCFLKKALVVVRAVWYLAPSPAVDFFSSLVGTRTAFARRPGPLTWRESLGLTQELEDRLRQ